MKDLDLPVEDGKRFGLHSGRGGAATAASNAGVPLEAIRQVGFRQSPKGLHPA